jgi:GMP synthase-like glutamine amidotransferase
MRHCSTRTCGVPCAFVRALLISNSYDADPGFVGQRLRHHGYQFDECHRERPGEWPELEGHDLVLLLGSDWSVYWEHVADHVQAEVDLVQAAHRRGVPIFGICFGNQIMAHALGGTVERASVPEIGWYEVDTDEPAVIAPGPWLQWHSDIVTLPAAATEMARTSVGPQAWRLGRSFCTQFHPEATESVLRRWIEGGGADEYVAFGGDPQQFLEMTRTNVSQSRSNSDILVDWFCETVVSAATPVVLDTA